MGWAWAIVISVVCGGVAGGYGDWGGGGDEVVKVCWVLLGMLLVWSSILGDMGEKRVALFCVVCSVCGIRCYA